jgi:hypothetical protein
MKEMNCKYPLKNFCPKLSLPGFCFHHPAQIFCRNMAFTTPYSQEYLTGTLFTAVGGTERFGLTVVWTFYAMKI